MSAKITESLKRFGSLCKEHTGDSLGSSTFQQARRHSSLIPTFSGGKLLEFWPKLFGEPTEICSSGEESEVEITMLQGQKLNIRDKMTHEGKIGPRMQQVVDEILDMNWIYETVSNHFTLIS